MTMKTAIDAPRCDSVLSSTPPFSVNELDDKVAQGALRLSRSTDTSDRLGLASHRGQPHAAGIADDLREPAPARVLVPGLGRDPRVRAAYAGDQRWTRDPRGSRVQSYSPRTPHGKVTKCQSIRIKPCQGVIIG